MNAVHGFTDSVDRVLDVDMRRPERTRDLSGHVGFVIISFRGLLGSLGAGTVDASTLTR